MCVCALAFAVDQVECVMCLNGGDFLWSPLGILKYFSSLLGII